MTDQPAPTEHPPEPDAVGTAADWPSRRAGLRNDIARAIHRYDNHHALSGNDIPSKHHRGEADAVLTLLYRAWPWLRAEADELDQARTELADRAAADSADAAAGSYAGRAERVEAQLERVQKLLDTGSIGCCAHLVRTALAHDDHAIAQPERWLHVALTSPDETSANTSALNLRDHLAAEFDGVSMRITTNAVEGGDPPICELPHMSVAEEDECEQRRLTADRSAADVLVATARGAVHESLIHLPAPEADRVRALIADLETAVEGRTAMGFAAPVDECDHDSQVIDHEGVQYWACLKCGRNHGRVDAPSCSPGAEETEPNNPAPPGLREQLHTAIESEMYEYRERTMWWPEGGITGEIARLATRGAMEVLQPQDGTHVYLSTGCWHGDHDYCKAMTGLNGAKRPASCKKCGARCICPCHAEQPKESP